MFSNNRKVEEIVLDFKESDFYHLAGLQYITDVSIPRDRKNVLTHIENGKITEEMLRKSKHYDSKNEHYNVKLRLEEIKNLEQYLDVDNQIKIFSLDDEVYLKSKIKADYLIESRLSNKAKTMYIFVGRRREIADRWCIVSFFEKKERIYKGKKLYWMLKEKITSMGTEILYQHPNYKDEMEKR